MIANNTHGRGRHCFHPRPITQTKVVCHRSWSNSCDRSLPNNQPCSFRFIFHWRVGEGDRECMQGMGFLPSNQTWGALNLRQNIETASRMFFGQCLEEKRKVRRDERNAMGYYDSEHTKNVRDWKEVFDCSQRPHFGASHCWWTRWSTHSLD